MKINILFDIEYGKTKQSLNKIEKGDIPYISSGGNNNGISDFVNLENIYINVISVSRVGTICSSFYHSYNCCINDNCLVLKPKLNLFQFNKEIFDQIMLFYAFLINKEKYKYMYGRQITPKRLGETKILSIEEVLVMINKFNYNEIDISNYSKPFSEEKIKLPDIDEWKKFKLKDLFNIKTANNYKSQEAEQNQGNNIFIVSSENNNGVGYLTSLEPKHNENTISIAKDGSVCSTFYQEKKWSGNGHIYALYSKYENFNKYIAFFLIPLIKKEKFKYNFGRAFIKDIMENTIIKLPSIFNEETKQYTPDWNLIENYIKSLSYSKYL